MTNRSYHANGLDFALTILDRLEHSDKPTAVEIANAKAIVTNAADFLRAENAAIALLYGRDDT